MSNEIRMAFGHPSERSEATAEGDPLDRISLRDHIAEVEIGAFQAERGTTQRVRFNIVVEVRPVAGRVDDDVDRILSYDRVTEAIEEELADERLNLLETLAERIAQRILDAPQAVRVFVRIEKLDRGPGALGVEIVRARKDLPRRDREAEARVHPVLVYLSNAAIASGHVPALLDRLEARGDPVLLCVGAPDAPAPRSRAPLAQRRIDLLAIEQNAWVLAGQDRRCVVINTRTELDWSMKHGQIAVLAPSKIVLDAVEGPAVQPKDSPSLAAWFAGEVKAKELILVGEAAPDEVWVPVRRIEPGEAP